MLWNRFHPHSISTTPRPGPKWRWIESQLTFQILQGGCGRDTTMWPDGWLVCQYLPTNECFPVTDCIFSWNPWPVFTEFWFNSSCNSDDVSPCAQPHQCESVRSCMDVTRKHVTRRGQNTSLDIHSTRSRPHLWLDQRQFMYYLFAYEESKSLYIYSYLNIQ